MENDDNPSPSLSFRFSRVHRAYCEHLEVNIGSKHSCSRAEIWKTSIDKEQTAKRSVFFFLFFSGLRWGKAMLAYTKLQQMKNECWNYTSIRRPSISSWILHIIITILTTFIEFHLLPHGCPNYFPKTQIRWDWLFADFLVVIKRWRKLITCRKVRIVRTSKNCLTLYILHSKVKLDSISEIH